MTPQTTRRTRKDLYELFNLETFRTDEPDADRKARLRSHGWIDEADNLTGEGRALYDGMRQFASRTELERVCDLWGFGTFIDAADELGPERVGELGQLTLELDGVFDTAIRGSDWGLVDDADPIVRIAPKGDDDRIRNYIQVKTQAANHGIASKAVGRLRSKGFNVRKCEDRRTRNNKSNYKFNVAPEDEGMPPK